MRRQRRSRSRAGAGVGAALALVAGLAAGGPDTPPPSVVAIVVDASGSLSEADAARARTFATGLLERLPQGSQVAVFSFADESRLLQPRTSSPDLVRRALARVRRAGSFTALHDALYDAGRHLEEVPGAPRAIVLLTDGRDENSSLTLEDALEVARGARIPVFAVGLGRVEERALRRIAKLTGGEYMKGTVTAAALAPRLLATGQVPAATGSGAAPAARAPAPGRPAPRASASPPRRDGPDANAAAARAAWWIAAGLVLGGAIVLGLRRRRHARCAECGRPLAGALASCAFCGRETAAGATAPPGLSPTVVERLNITEEYLEKTVTLRERPVLTITRGPGTGELFELSHACAVSIGRARANDIVLKDVSISGQHCRIRPEEGAFVLHDLKSTNGTFVNDRRVERHRLADGDVVQVGETVMEFRREHLR